VFELLLEACEDALDPPVIWLLVAWLLIDGVSKVDCLILLLVILLNMVDEADILADMDWLLLSGTTFSGDWAVLLVAFGCDIKLDAFCEMADRAPAAILALAWAFEAIVFAFLNWLDGK